MQSHVTAQKRYLNFANLINLFYTIVRGNRFVDEVQLFGYIKNCANNGT